MATTIQNLTRQPRTYVLHAPGDLGERLPKRKQVVVRENHDPKTGNRSTNAATRNIPTSITLMPKGRKGDTIEGLPDGVRGVPEIQRDAKAGLIGVAAVAWDLGPEVGARDPKSERKKPNVDPPAPAPDAAPIPARKSGAKED